MSLIYRKLARSCVKPENMELGEAYAFTLNAQEQDFKTMTRKVYEYLRHLANLKYCNYSLVFEFSQLGRLHMHGTIWIDDASEDENKKDYSNLANFFAYDMCHLNTYFTFEIDTIGPPQKNEGEDHRGRPSEKTTGEDHPEDCPHGKDSSDDEDGGRLKHRIIWANYCEKQQHFMVPFLNKMDLPSHITNATVDFYVNNKATPDLKRFLR